MPCSFEDKISSFEFIPLSETTVISLGIFLDNLTDKFLSTSKVVKSLLLIPTKLGFIDKASVNSLSECTSTKKSKSSS